MRYLKTFENLKESEAMQLKSKLQEFSYILEDEGFIPMFEKRNTSLRLCILGYTTNELSNAESDNDFFDLIENASNKIMNLKKSNHYSEWFDRIKDVCESNGFDLRNSKDSSAVGSGIFLIATPIKKLKESLTNFVKEIGDDAIKVVDDFRYILEDDGYNLRYRKAFLDDSGKFTNVKNAKESVVIINILGADNKRSVDGENYWRPNLMKSDCYLEFIDRLSEECKRLGYSVWSPIEIDGTYRIGNMPDVIFIYENIFKAQSRDYSYYSFLIYSI